MTDLSDVALESSTEEDKGSIFDVFANFHLALGRMADTLDRMDRRDQRRMAALPVNYPFNQQSTGITGTDIKDFGGPQPGRFWVVRMLSAIAVPLAANAAVVSWYVGQVMPGPAAGMLPANMFRWQFPSVPANQNFTGNVITVRAGEHLIAGITGAPAASTISMSATVDDYPMWAQALAVAVE